MRLLNRPTIILLAAFFILFAKWTASAGEKEPPESEVKAAFLLNFPKYVEWPTGSFASNNGPFVVAFFGGGEVNDAFREIIKERRVINGHPVVFLQLEKEEDCTRDEIHMLFIARSEHRRIPAILDRTRHTSMLTVSESDDFVQKGGMINMVRKDRKIRLQINLTATRRAQLKVSSKLLSVAEVLETDR